jgi:nucleotide-binding universal stress UspA family protein
MFQSILVATDNSYHARKAVDLAADLAEKYQARLLILHVIDPRQASPDLRHMAEVEHMIKADPGNKGLNAVLGLPGDWAARMTSLRESADDTMAVLTAIGNHLLGGARQQVSDRVQNVETRLEQGDPAQCILDVADQEEADLIVVGSRGLSEMKGMLMGSVSHKVSQLASCTCITVK